MLTLTLPLLRLESRITTEWSTGVPRKARVIGLPFPRGPHWQDADTDITDAGTNTMPFPWL